MFVVRATLPARLTGAPPRHTLCSKETFTRCTVSCETNGNFRTCITSNYATCMFCLSQIMKNVKYSFCLFQTSESIKTDVRISCVTSYLTTHTGRPDTHTLLQAPAEWRSLEEARTEAVDRSQRKNRLPQYHTGRLRCTSLATCDRDCTYKSQS